jgi:murein L,D-transpeptidase YcbB/YkuD
LGRIKFIFPNQYFVFLHDTPSKSLFGKTSRAFSSGCIRIERPFELAELLLKDSEKWRQKDMMSILNSAKPRTVFLPEHMVVMLLYLTAHVNDDETVHFKKDIYGRDKALLKELDGQFRIHRQVKVGG